MGQAISRRLDGIPTTEVAIRVIQPPGGPLRPKPASRTRAVCVGARADDGGLPFSVGAAAGQPHTDLRAYVADRKSVVWGTSVYVRVDLVGCRSIKKKKR